MTIDRGTKKSCALRAVEPGEIVALTGQILMVVHARGPLGDVLTDEKISAVDLETGVLCWLPQDTTYSPVRARLEITE